MSSWGVHICVFPGWMNFMQDKCLLSCNCFCKGKVCQVFAQQLTMCPEHKQTYPVPTWQVEQEGGIIHVGHGDGHGEVDGVRGDRWRRGYLPT